MSDNQEKINKISDILFEIKSIAKLSALASDSCIIDKELQLNDSLEYYFAMRSITNLAENAKNIIDDVIIK